MKIQSILFAFFTLFITACSTKVQFSESDLKSEIYKGYWAMYPVDNIYRVVKFHPNGIVKIYDYTCNNQYESYTLNETLTHYLSKVSANRFSVLDDKKKAFATLEITRVDSNNLWLKQFFTDKKIEPRQLNLHYQNQIGAKPFCS